MLGAVVGFAVFVATILGMLRLQGGLGGSAPPRDGTVLSTFAPANGGWPEHATPPTPHQDPERQSPGPGVQPTPTAQSLPSILGAHRFEPGGLFDFESLDPEMRAREIDELLGRSRAIVAEVERRRASLRTFEDELLARQRDLEDRERAIAAEMLRVEQERDRLDRRIREFERDVILVRRADMPGIVAYAGALAAFRPERAAAFVGSECENDEGMRRVVRALGVMDPHTAAEILARLEDARVRELLVQRLKVVREPPR